MNRILTFLTVLSLLGCTRWMHRPDPYYVQPGSYRIAHTGNISVIHQGETGSKDTVYVVDSCVSIPVKTLVGIIISPEGVKGDTIKRVWVQWGENGAWIPYVLPDLVK